MYGIRLLDVTYLSSILVVVPLVMAGQVSVVVPMGGCVSGVRTCSSALAASLANCTVDGYAGVLAAMASTTKAAPQSMDASYKEIWGESPVHLLRYGVMSQGVTTPEQKRCSVGHSCTVFSCIVFSCTALRAMPERLWCIGQLNIQTLLSGPTKIRVTAVYDAHWGLRSGREALHGR